MEVSTRCRHVGEIVGIGLLALLLSTADIIVGFADGNIVFQCLLLALLEGILVLGNCQAAVRKT